MLDTTAALGEANKAAMDDIAISNPPASTSELCSILRLDDDIHFAVEHVKKSDELIQALP